MNKNEIISEEFKDLLCSETGRWDFEEITDEDISNIKAIQVTGRKLTGEINDVRLKELTVLKNLEELTIMDFVIGDSINDILEQFPRLKTLKFGNCDFEGCTEIKTKEPLKSFAIFGGRNVSMKNFPSAQFLRFEGIEVPFESIDLDNLKVARVYGCRVIDAHDIADKKNIEEIELVDSLVYGKKDENGRRKKIDYLEVPKGVVIGVDYTDESSLER